MEINPVTPWAFNVVWLVTLLAAFALWGIAAITLISARARLSPGVLIVWVVAIVILPIAGSAAWLLIRPRLLPTPPEASGS